MRWTEFQICKMKNWSSRTRRCEHSQHYPLYTYTWLRGKFHVLYSLPRLRERKGKRGGEGEKDRDRENATPKPREHVPSRAKQRPPKRGQPGSVPGTARHVSLSPCPYHCPWPVCVWKMYPELLFERDKQPT